MSLWMDLFLCVLGFSLALGYIDENGVKIVHVDRFGNDKAICEERQVCADIFNFTRTLDNGGSQRESRFIQNCQCGDDQAPCGGGNQLLFRETRTQSMITCEDREYFPMCEEGEVAKEQHNMGPYVLYKVNCVCPNNDDPQGFFNKMTVRAYPNNMGGPGIRLFKCRSGY